MIDIVLARMTQFWSWLTETPPSKLPIKVSPPIPMEEVTLVASINTEGPVPIIFHASIYKSYDDVGLLSDFITIKIFSVKAPTEEQARVDLIQTCQNVKQFRWALPWIQDDLSKGRDVRLLADDLQNYQRTHEVLES